MSVATMEIGSMTEAEILRDCGRGEVPEGWQRIGSGSFREVFLSPSGVAYKRGTDYCNVNEDKSSKRCREMIPLRNVKIPATSLYEFDDDATILAMEFVKGVMYSESDVCNCAYKCCHDCYALYREIEEYYGIEDMHSFNMIVTEDGDIYVIDLGDY